MEEGKDRKKWRQNFPAFLLGVNRRRKLGEGFVDVRSSEDQAPFYLARCRHLILLTGLTSFLPSLRPIRLHPRALCFPCSRRHSPPFTFICGWRSLRRYGGGCG